MYDEAIRPGMKLILFNGCLALLLPFFFIGEYISTNKPATQKLVDQVEAISMRPNHDVVVEPFQTNFKQTSHDLSFNAVLVSGTELFINYTGLEGSNPKEMGYTLYLWQGIQAENQSEAKASQPILNTDQDGSVVFQNLQISSRDYVVGIATSNASNLFSVATVAHIPNNAVPYDTINSKPSAIQVIYYGSNSLVAQFDTPLFNTPDKNENWVGLFRGKFNANLFKGVGLVKWIPVSTITTNSGDVAINNIPGGLAFDSYYTLVYGIGFPDTNSSHNKNFIYNIICATEFRTAPRTNNN